MQNVIGKWHFVFTPAVSRFRPFTSLSACKCPSLWGPVSLHNRESITSAFSFPFKHVWFHLFHVFATSHLEKSVCCVVDVVAVSCDLSGGGAFNLGLHSGSCGGVTLPLRGAHWPRRAALGGFQVLITFASFRHKSPSTIYKRRPSLCLKRPPNHANPRQSARRRMRLPPPCYF